MMVTLRKPLTLDGGEPVSFGCSFPYPYLFSQTELSPFSCYYPFHRPFLSIPFTLTLSALSFLSPFSSIPRQPLKRCR
jgi:hypothetical protein